MQEHINRFDVLSRYAVSDKVTLVSNRVSVAQSCPDTYNAAPGRQMGHLLALPTRYQTPLKRLCSNQSFRKLLLSYSKRFESC